MARSLLDRNSKLPKQTPGTRLTGSSLQVSRMLMNFCASACKSGFLTFFLTFLHNIQKFFPSCESLILVCSANKHENKPLDQFPLPSSSLGLFLLVIPNSLFFSSAESASKITKTLAPNVSRALNNPRIDKNQEFLTLKERGVCHLEMKKVWTVRQFFSVCILN